MHGSEGELGWATTPSILTNIESIPIPFLPNSAQNNGLSESPLCSCAAKISEAFVQDDVYAKIQGFHSPLPHLPHHNHPSCNQGTSSGCHKSRAGKSGRLAH